jgi:hypothetical protein
MSAAVVMVAVAIVLGLVVSNRIRADAAAQAAAIVAAATPLPRVTALPRITPPPTPTPTPRPTPAPTVSVPVVEPGPDGMTPPLPVLGIEGADPAVVALIKRAIDGIADLETYRFLSGLSGRSIVDLSKDGGFNLGAQGDLENGRQRRIDLLVTSQLVEFDHSAAVSSTERLVIIGTTAWSFRRGEDPQKAEFTGSIAQFIEIILPAGLAERVLLPFAGGFEEVGIEAHGGVDAVHYQATRAGRAAYATVTGIRGPWTIDLWVAESDGHLVSFLAKGGAANADDGLYAQIDITDANDPDIEIKTPK